MKAVIVVGTQINGFGRSALLVDDVQLWVVVSNPLDGDRRILVNAAGSFQKAFHFRQGIESSRLHAIHNSWIRRMSEAHCRQL